MRATRRLTTLYISKVSSFTLRIAEFVTLFVIGLHWNACTQFLVAVSTGFPEGSWVEQLGLQEAPAFRRYTWSLFSAASQMLAIGYGPVDPVLEQEVWVVMASFGLSTFLFPILISIITTSLISRDSMREEFNRKVEVWNQYMAHRRLPLKLRNRIRSFQTYRWRTHRGVNEERMLGDLPSSLRVEVRLITCQALIREVPIFRDAPKGFISSLVPYLHLELFLEGEWVIRESTTGREMYFIHNGVVEIIQDGKTIDSLEKGSYFGEVALMQDVVRTASCLAATNCEVSILQKRDLDEVLDSFPQVRSRMEDAAHEALMRDVARTTDGRAQRTSSSGLPLSSVLRPMNPDESSLIDIEDGFAKADSGGRSRKSLMNIVNSIAEVTDDL